MKLEFTPRRELSLRGGNLSRALKPERDSLSPKLLTTWRIALLVGMMAN